MHKTWQNLFSFTHFYQLRSSNLSIETFIMKYLFSSMNTFIKSTYIKTFNLFSVGYMFSYRHNPIENTCLHTLLFKSFSTVQYVFERGLLCLPRLHITGFYFKNILKCNLFLWWNKWIFIITSLVFSVTWSFRNHSNMLICCWNISSYYQCSKQFANVFTVAFDQFNASLLKKNNNYF